MRSIVWLSLLTGLLWSACGEPDAEAEALCDCVQTDAQGQWDMHLSPDCMALCVEQFGPELKGMEAWFRENCGYDFRHPEVEEGKPVERAVFRP